MVAVGIIEQFLHPPIQALEPFLDYHGPYTGNNTLTVWGSTPGPVFTDISVTDTFGIQVQLNGSIPPGYGFTNGWVSDDTLYDEAIYESRLAQLVVQHQFISDAWVTTQMEEIFSFPRVFLWTISFPGRVGLLVAPGLAFDLFYLRVL